MPLLELCVILLTLGAAHADVILMASGDADTTLSLPDLPCDFGPDLPDEGVEGFLRVSWRRLELAALSACHGHGAL